MARQLPLAPEWKATLNADYRIELDALDIVPSLLFVYTDDQYADLISRTQPAVQEQVLIPSYTTIDLSVALRGQGRSLPPDDHRPQPHRRELRGADHARWPGERAAPADPARGRPLLRRAVPRRTSAAADRDGRVASARRGRIILHRPPPGGLCCPRVPLQASGPAHEVVAMGVVRALGRVNGPLSLAARNLAGALLAVMLALALAQIVSRGVFHYSLDWAEELARVALVWSVLLVAPFAYRNGAHVAIVSFAEALPPRLLACTSLLLNVLIVWILAVLFVESFAFWRRGLEIMACDPRDQDGVDLRDRARPRSPC